MAVQSLHFGRNFSASVIEGTIFCAHAGLSPQLYDLDLVSYLTVVLTGQGHYELCEYFWKRTNFQKGLKGLHSQFSCMKEPFDT